MDVVERLRNFIITDMAWKGNPDELTPDFSLIENHILDSLGLFMLVAFLSETFGITIGFGELDPRDFETVEAIARLVERKRAPVSPDGVGA